MSDFDWRKFAGNLKAIGNAEYKNIADGKYEFEQAKGVMVSADVLMGIAEAIVRTLDTASVRAVRQ